MTPTTSTSNEVVQELRVLPVDAIVPNPSQPRRHFDEAALKALAGSVKERGVLQPVLVRHSSDGKYELIAGERRWRAAQLAGLQSIPALVCRYDDAAALEAGLIENMAREDLNPVEEARACATLVNELGLTQEQVGRRVGRSRPMVSSVMRLLKLSEDILELLERGELSEHHGKVLLLAKDPKTRSQLARAAVQERWSVRALEGRALVSNSAGSASRRDPEAQERNAGQAQDMAALNVARAWGDVLCVEVHVRTLPRRQVRLEVVFHSPDEALASAERLAAAVTRGAKLR